MDMTNVLPLRNLEFHGLLMIAGDVLSKMDNMTNAKIGLDKDDMDAMKWKIDAVLEFLAQEDTEVADYFDYIDDLSEDEQLKWPTDPKVLN